MCVFLCVCVFHWLLNPSSLSSLIFCFLLHSVDWFVEANHEPAPNAAAASPEERTTMTVSVMAALQSVLDDTNSTIRRLAEKV